MPPLIPSDGYTTVKAYDWMDLLDYLTSDDTSYTITLMEMENTNIYLQRSISVVMPMRIIGSPGTIYTIHSKNREGGNGFYCLDLQADLELQYCDFIGYGGTSGTGGGVAAGSPPLNIRDGSTFTMMGKGSVLELHDIGSGVEVRPGSRVRLGEGVSLVITDESGDLIYRAGVEKLVISGNVSLKDKLTVGESAVLQIDYNGELRVEPEATLTLDNSLKELRLDGDIVVDRTDSPVGVLALTGGLTVVSLLEKITGINGSLTIENGIPEITMPLEYGANTIARLSGDGISVGKRVSSDLGGVIETSDDIVIPKGKRLVVGGGADLNVKNNLTLEGGTLDVAGNVNVTGNGQIIINAEDKFYAIPKGLIVIGSSGSINIEDGGTLNDESASPDARYFTFPSYGAGALIIKDTGHAFMGAYEAIGGSGPLQLTDAYSALSMRTVGGKPEFRLIGKGTLTMPSDSLALEGRFVIEGDSVLTITEGIFTVNAPNQLTGTITDPTTTQLKITTGARVEIDSTGTDETTDPLGAGNYEWSGTPPGWNRH